MMLATLIRSMSAAGASVDAIAMAVEAIEAQQQAEADRRAKAAERKRRSRANAAEGVTVTGQSRDTLSPDKEAPHTPKEINPSPGRCAAPARTREDLDRIEDRCREAAGAQRDRNPSPGLFDLRPILAWLDAGFSLEEDILPVIRAKAPRNLGSWGYFAGALRDALDASHRAVSAAREAARSPRSGEGDARPQFRDPILRALQGMHDRGELDG